MNATLNINDLWRKLGTSPRELRKKDPATLTLDEATALSCHAWLCAPKGWKEAVHARLRELEGGAK